MPRDLRAGRSQRHHRLGRAHHSQSGAADRRRRSSQLLPVSALIGAIFLVTADTLARNLTPAEIPVGIVTAIVGTPIFALLLRRNAGGGAR